MKYLKLLIIILIVCGCKKSVFLDANPNDKIIIPESLADMDALLDNNNVMNGDGIEGLTPVFGEIASDDHYIPNNVFPALTKGQINLYAWKDDFYENTRSYYGWELSYKAVLYANAVLSSLEKKPIDQSTDFNRIKGSALFHRAHSFYQLAQIFAPQYVSSSALQKPGIPLRLTTNINESITRASLEATYTKIVADLLNSISLLPNVPSYKTRPSKAASFGLLARVHLTMQSYDKALIYADSCLKYQSALIDYNTISLTRRNPFLRYNDEVIFACNMGKLDEDLITVFNVVIDSNLYASYHQNDLRRSAFFGSAANYGNKGMFFKGTYEGSSKFFSGIATDEIYLIRAECYARLNNVVLAMKDLNFLMAKRWRSTVPYPEITATNSNDALAKILVERRKELIYRGLRWADLRRLNAEGANISIKRMVNGKEITLQPNSLHYTFLIPPDVMNFNPDMIQNDR